MSKFRERIFKQTKLKQELVVKKKSGKFSPRQKQGIAFQPPPTYEAKSPFSAQKFYVDSETDHTDHETDHVDIEKVDLYPDTSSITVSDGGETDTNEYMDESAGEDMSGQVKCPPFCRQRCSTKHHPLLVAILNCRDNPQAGLMKQRLADLEQVVEQHLINGWSLDKDIPDRVEDYQHPIGHWAASMGRVAALEWLLRKGFPPKTQTHQDQSSSLHRALSCLQETCPPPRRTMHIFRTLLGLLEDALLVSNEMGNTPLHTCCCMLYNSMPRVDFYTDCITQILDFAATHSDKRLLSQILNAQNNDGDTALHILCQTDRHMRVTQLLVEADADLDLTNLENHTPLQVAMTSNQNRTSSYLKQILQERDKNPLPRIKDILHKGSGSKRERASKKRKRRAGESSPEGETPEKIHNSGSDSMGTPGTDVGADLEGGILEQAAKEALTPVEVITDSPEITVDSTGNIASPVNHIDPSAMLQTSPITPAHTPATLHIPDDHMGHDQRTLFDNFTEILRPGDDSVNPGYETLTASLENLGGLPALDLPVSTSGGMLTTNLPSGNNQANSDVSNSTDTKNNAHTPQQSDNGSVSASTGDKRSSLTSPESIAETIMLNPVATPQGSDTGSMSSGNRAEPDSSQCYELDSDISTLNIPLGLGGESAPIPLSSQGDAFISFLQCCDPGTRQTIRGSMVRDSHECKKKLDDATNNVKEIGNSLAALQVQQADLVSTVKSLLERLEKLQAEEDSLNKDISSKTQELHNAHATQQGLEQRMHHCQAALDALGGLL